jgi:filamentous hemagglutinin
MEQAQADPAAGRVLPVEMTDPRWQASDGWVKMGQNINGVEIHYVYNTGTGVAADFKFK